MLVTKSMYPNRILLALLSLSLAAASHGQSPTSTVSPSKTDRVMTAREVFYVALDSNDGGSAAKPAAKPKPVVKRKPKPVAQPTPVAPSAAPSAQSAAVPASSTPEPSSGQATRSADSSDSPVIVKVANPTYPALGLKYSVFQYADGKRLPVDPDQIFRSNQHIQLTMEVSSPGYLYIVSRGASGKWSTLFPGSDAQPEANHLIPGRAYRMPPGDTDVITFYEPAGKEQLFLFLSRQPISSSEDLMMQMSGEKGMASAASPRPKSQERVMEAMNRLGDGDINHLTNVYARDLIVEKASSSDPQSTSASEPDPKAVSMYVVNPSGSADSHVVANITFKHE